jgi:chondroitin AC lyase
MLNGHQLLGYRSSIDFGTVGRGITRAGGTNNISAGVLDEMVLADPANSKAYLAWKAHLSGGPFASDYIGNNYFWKSDIMTQHGADYYLSAKIISKRTLGTEGLNGENLKGYNLPLGSTNIETTGNEYKDIAPVWDWTRIPGTTAEMNPDATVLTNYLYGSNLYGGGVSNGKNGAIAFEYDYKGVQAKKAYFFIGDAMICLGAGINGEKVKAIVTSVNQCYLSGDVSTDGGVLKTKVQTSGDLKWVYHNQIGYIFPEKALVTVAAKEQSGTWKSINKSESAEKGTKKIFSIWIDHGNKPQNGNYQYTVVPGLSLNDFKNYFSKHDLVTVKNDSTVQAVKSMALQIYAVVFYQPGKVDMGDGLVISSNQKALVLVSKKKNSYDVSVADPLCDQQGANIALSKKLSGANAMLNSSGTTINIAFPTGDLAGKTVTSNYVIQ